MAQCSSSPTNCGSKSGAESIKLRVLNVFTHSAYAPRVNRKNAAEISAIRRCEDLRALSRAAPGLTVLNLNMLDAPLRLELDFEQLMCPESIEHVSADQTAELAEKLRVLVGVGLVLAPLGLGHHVDHQMVHQAALLAFEPTRVAFYEDLPYACWTGQSDIAERIRRLPGRHVEHLFKAEHAQRRKRALAGIYASQIGESEAQGIARFLETYKSAERIWIPAHSTGWRKLTRRARALPPCPIPGQPRKLTEQTR